MMNFKPLSLFLMKSNCSQKSSLTLLRFQGSDELSKVPSKHWIGDKAAAWIHKSLCLPDADLLQGPFFPNDDPINSPMTTRLVIPRSIKFLAALSLPSLWRNSMHLAEPMMVPPMWMMPDTEDQWASTMLSPPSTMPWKRWKKLRLTLIARGQVFLWPCHRLRHFYQLSNIINPSQRPTLGVEANKKYCLLIFQFIFN